MNVEFRLHKIPFVVKFRELKRISNYIFTVDLAYVIDYLEAAPLFVGECAETRKEIQACLYDKSTPVIIDVE